MNARNRVSGFRLSEETINKLDELVKEEVIKNRTVGVEKAIDNLYESNKFKSETDIVEYIIYSLVKNGEIADDYKTIEVGSNATYIPANGPRVSIIKNTEEDFVIIFKDKKHSYFVKIEISKQELQEDK